MRWNSSKIIPDKQKLQTLNEVGLRLFKDGQSATTLSGGEAQRIKLAKELSRRATGRTVYYSRRAYNGLHFEDVRKLPMSSETRGSGQHGHHHRAQSRCHKIRRLVIDLAPGGADGGALWLKAVRKKLQLTKSHSQGMLSCCVNAKITKSKGAKIS